MARPEPIGMINLFTINTNVTLTTVCDISQQQLTGKRPCLTAHVTQLCHLQPNFFLDLPNNGLLRRLAGFDEAGQHTAAVKALEPRYRDLHILLRRDASHEAATAVAELLDPRDAAAPVVGDTAP